jgi:hypothetical protein
VTKAKHKRGLHLFHRKHRGKHARS